MVRRAKGTFFSFAQSWFFRFFSFLVFSGDLIDLRELKVTRDMRDARSSRHEWFKVEFVEVARLLGSRLKS